MESSHRKNEGKDLVSLDPLYLRKDGETCWVMEKFHSKILD